MTEQLLETDELERLQTINSYGVLGTPPEEVFDEITRLAARVCRVPAASVTLVGATRQWFKSRVGFDLQESPRAGGLCAKIMYEKGPIQLADLSQDPKYESLPFVCQAPHIRFYAAVPLRSPSGHPLGTFCVFDWKAGHIESEQMEILEVLAHQVEAQLELRRNLHEQSRIERELRKSESEQRALACRLEAEHVRLVEAQAVANLGNWETNLSTLAVTWSSQVHRIFQTDPETFKPTHQAFLERVHPDDREAVSSAFRSSIAAERPRSIQHRIVLPDGEIRQVEERWRVFLGEGDQPSRAVGTCQDITERRALEDQFLRVQRMESLGTLAGGMAHDLNNLLCPIIMGVDFLTQCVTDEAQLSLLKNMEESAARGAELVKQVLAFARGVEGAKVSIHPERVINEVRSILANTFPKNIRFELALPPDLWTVIGDPTQLHQVLLNLCVNARDAMPVGGQIKISGFNVELSPQSGLVNHQGEAVSGRHVLLQVEDTGEGIDRKALNRIFEPFFTTKKHGYGTGLGLSTVLGIVRGHGGFVDVTSEVGVGSVFKVYLPATEPEAAPLEEAPRVKALPRGRGELILLVDDENGILAVTKRVLESAGYKVVIAHDGAEGILRFTEHQNEVAAIITDIMMPIMDGPTMVATLRHLDQKVPILAASGLSTQSEVQQPGGVNYFMPKPYDSEILLRTVHQALSDRVET